MALIGATLYGMIIMIKASKLKRLLHQIPDDAEVYAYEGEQTGIVIKRDYELWFIGCYDSKEKDTYTEGFE